MVTNNPALHETAFTVSVDLLGNGSTPVWSDREHRPLDEPRAHLLHVGEAGFDAAREVSERQMVGRAVAGLAGGGPAGAGPPAAAGSDRERRQVGEREEVAVGFGFHARAF